MAAVSGSSSDAVMVEFFRTVGAMKPSACPVPTDGSRMRPPVNPNQASAFQIGR